MIGRHVNRTVTSNRPKVCSVQRSQLVQSNRPDQTVINGHSDGGVWMIGRYINLLGNYMELYGYLLYFHSESISRKGIKMPKKKTYSAGGITQKMAVNRLREPRALDKFFLG